MINSTLGANIRKYRREAGITQEKLAEEIDVSVNHVTAVENGYSGISLSKLIQVSQVLCISIDHLLGLDHGSKTVLAKEINMLLQDCSEKEMQMFYAVIKTLKVEWRK